MAISQLNGKEIFVTAGGTRAYLDAVRYLGNRSSGRLGAEIAAECLRRGAYVSYFHGESALTPIRLVKMNEMQLPEEALGRLDLIEIETVQQLAGAIERELKEGYYDVAIHAMAVLDFIPDIESTQPGKKKSDMQEWTIKLVRTPKVIDMIKKISPATLLVGFKLEINITPEGLEESARKLMEHSGAEIVVANDIAHIKQSGYKCSLLERSEEEGRFTKIEVEGREETASALCDRIEEHLKRKPVEGE